MTKLDIYANNRFEKYSKIRKAYRGILVSDEKILLTYEVNTDQWFIPGGGIELDESFEECCVRELAEETGYLVKPIKQYLTINEYYEEWFFTSYYFVCEFIGGNRKEEYIKLYKNNVLSSEELDHIRVDGLKSLK